MCVLKSAPYVQVTASSNNTIYEAPVLGEGGDSVDTMFPGRPRQPVSPLVASAMWMGRFDVTWGGISLAIRATPVVISSTLYLYELAPTAVFY